MPAAAVAIAAVFLFTFAGDGLRAHLTGDDLMNSYQYWSHPARQILRESVSFYPATVIRPLGALFYELIFTLFGLNPLTESPVLRFASESARSSTYFYTSDEVARGGGARLSSRRVPRPSQRLLLHPEPFTITMLLFYLAFIYYLQIRERGTPGQWQSVILLVLYVAALDAKEMAVTLPVLLVYELVCHPPHIPPFSALRRWALCEGRFFWLTLPVTAGFIGSRITIPHPMITNPAYHPTISLHMFMSGWRHYLSVLFYQQFEVNSAKVVMFWAMPLVVAWIARRRELLVVWFLIFVVLPVIFIEPRGLYAIYLILPACYLFAAVCLVLTREFLMRVVASRWRPCWVKFVRKLRYLPALLPIPTQAWEAGVFP